MVRKAAQAKSWPSGATYMWTVALSALAGCLAVYVTLSRYDNVAARATAAGATAVGETGEGSGAELSGSAVNPLSRGQMAAFRFHSAPQAVPELTFVDEAGATRRLQDWKGKVVLLNLWATWCAPCRKEMPALDRLQKALGSDAFEVVALSVDRTGIEGAKKFLEQINVEALKLYVDPTSRATSLLKAVGMPTTLLIDKEGRELGRLTGPAEWDGDDAKHLVQASLLTH